MLCARGLSVFGILGVLLLVQGCDLFGSSNDTPNNDGPTEVCTPGEMLCAGDELKRCANDGSDFTTLTNCDYGCEDGECLGKPGCTPKCDGKACGDDGCGATCGMCDDGDSCSKGKCVAVAGVCTPGEKKCDGNKLQRCSDDGAKWTLLQECEVSCADNQCESIPGCTSECAGKACGDDGCLGSCGECVGTDICVDGQCIEQIETCQPKCAGRNCGPNGCGGSCGTCSGANVCNEATGQCVSSQTGVITGTLSMEVLSLAQDESNALILNGPEQMPAAGLLAAVYGADGQTFLGASEVQQDGSFSIPIGTAVTGAEQLVFVCLWVPDWEATENPLIVLDAADGGEPQSGQRAMWGWNATVEAGGNAGDLNLTLDSGSGAAYMFLFARAAMETVLFDFLKGDLSRLASLSLVWSPGAPWSCGSCYGSQDVQYGTDGSKQASQSIYIGGEESGSSAWGYPVILHEFGHYVARNYSRDDSPGGSHTYGVPIAPPFAWSEGWASFFAVSTFSRFMGEPVSWFWDIQGGSSFWIDYGQMGASAEGMIGGPNPDLGQTQNLDESWVAAMLWHLWDGGDFPDPQADEPAALGTENVVATVTSQRFLNMDRGAQGADFVDFADAAMCNQPDAAQDIYDTIVQALGFPHDGEPVCSNRTDAPLEMTLSGTTVGDEVLLTARVEVTGRLPGPLVLSVDIAGDGQLAAGVQRETLLKTPMGTTFTRTWRVKGLKAEVTVRAMSESQAAGAYAVADWPKKQRHMTQPEALPIKPVTFRGVRIDRAFPLRRAD